MELPSVYWLLVAWFLLIGAALGSFGNVLVLRLPERRTLQGRSGCPHCKRTLEPLELIPLVSFLWLHGRCRGCSERISWQYPLVEAASMLLVASALPLAAFQILPALLLGIAFWALLLIALIDARTQTIPDVLTLTVCVAGAGYHLSFAHTLPLLAPVLGGAFFGGLWLMSRGRWLGSGDVLLGVAIGMLVGSAQQLLVALLCTYVGGSIIVLVLLACGVLHRSDRIAFGPLLAAGAFASFMVGDVLLGLLRFSAV